MPPPPEQAPRERAARVRALAGVTAAAAVLLLLAALDGRHTASIHSHTLAELERGDGSVVKVSSISVTSSTGGLFAQQARLRSWRETQSILVHEETAMEEGALAATARGVARAARAAAKAAAAAAAADPLLDAEMTLGEHGLSTVTAAQGLRLAETEQLNSGD